MAIDMKKTIAEAASNLLFEKKVKKLTVKDIVNSFGKQMNDNYEQI